MKVRYVHSSEPEKVKIYDTDKSYDNNLFVTASKTRKQWVEEELGRFERDKQKGLVLEYEVMEEPGNDNL